MPFITFRIMVGLGFLMLGVGLWSLWARWKGTLYDTPSLHRVAVAMGGSGFVAVLAGWYTTEVGRQPWTVYGHLRTAESLSPVSAPAVGTSLLIFIAVYFVVFGVGVYYLLKLMRRPPTPLDTDQELDAGPIRTAGIVPGATQDHSLGGRHGH